MYTITLFSQVADLVQQTSADSEDGRKLARALAQLQALYPQVSRNLFLVTTPHNRRNLQLLSEYLATRPMKSVRHERHHPMTRNVIWQNDVFTLSLF